MDTPAASDESSSRGSRPPELTMSPEIEREIEHWRMTGDPPFPELRLSSREYWLRFTTMDLRLVHHIAGLSIDMHQRGYAACTVWAQKMPVLVYHDFQMSTVLKSWANFAIFRLLEIAITSDFVMSAILALSASHLAWETNDSETDHLAYHHRGVALKGLHEAIGSFSRDNSEAILAASMLLSWQATEWYVSKHLLKSPKTKTDNMTRRSWASLQQGVSTVSVQKPSLSTKKSKDP
jgi:Fungal specific transcription factor domain